MKILYYVPFTDRIHGGIQVLYEHVLLLREMGHDAFMYKDGGGEVTWFRHGAPSWEEPLKNLGEYAVVIPEICPEIVDRFPGAARKILFAQAWFLMARPMEKLGCRTYAALGYTDVMSCGEGNSREAKSTALTEELPLHTVRNGVYLGREYFQPRPEERITNSVLMLPRKRADFVETLSGRLGGYVPASGGPEVTVRRIDGVPQQELAEAYRRADVFVHVTLREGLSLPPMEAMLSGCALAAFPGRTGGDYLIDGTTALLAPDGDIDALESCVKRLFDNPALKERIRRGGRSYIEENFTVEGMKAGLKEVYGQP